ncbi:MAG TPA: hypothetical protein VGQ08_06900 [Nitrospiraceae bacterium]|jgi:hypothetical protein|nr:hypothetical protein [Nitrospiraceae bacterium]
MDLDQGIRLLQGLLTPVIAAIATYIAWQQWRTNQQKLNLDRYDRRLRVYEEVRKILSIITRDAKASTEDLLKFRTSESEADFLFGPEVMEYIDQIYKRGLSLWRWNQEYRDYTQAKPPGYDHAKVVDEMHKELEWLTTQFEPAKQLFRKYLKVGD